MEKKCVNLKVGRCETSLPQKTQPLANAPVLKFKELLGEKKVENANWQNKLLRRF